MSDTTPQLSPSSPSLAYTVTISRTSALRDSLAVESGAYNEWLLLLSVLLRGYHDDACSDASCRRRPQLGVQCGIGTRSRLDVASLHTGNRSETSDQQAWSSLQIATIKPKLDTKVHVGRSVRSHMHIAHGKSRGFGAGREMRVGCLQGTDWKSAARRLARLLLRVGDFRIDQEAGIYDVSKIFDIRDNKRYAIICSEYIIIIVGAAAIDTTNGDASSQLISSEGGVGNKKISVVVANGTTGAIKKSSSDASSKLIISESSGSVTDGAVSSSVVESVSSSSTLTKSSSSKIIESVSSSTVVTGGTTEIISSSESQQLQQGSSGQHASLAIMQTGEKSTGIHQESSSKHEASSSSTAVSESSSMVKMESSSSSTAAKSESNRKSSTTQSKQLRQESDQSLAITEGSAVKSYVEESSSSTMQMSQSKHEAISSSTTSEIVTSYSSSSLDHKNQQEALTSTSHKTDIDSKQLQLAGATDISSVSQGFTTSNTSESSQKFVSSSQSSEVVESISQQKFISSDSTSSSIQQGASTVQHSTVITDDVRENAAVTNTTTSKSTSKSSKKSVTEKKDAAKADINFKYSGPIKEQCICEICTCGRTPCQKRGKFRHFQRIPNPTGPVDNNDVTLQRNRNKTAGRFDGFQRSSAQSTLGLASLTRGEHSALVAASGYALYLFLLHDGAHGMAPLTLCTFQRVLTITDLVELPPTVGSSRDQP
ncbi:hypothetical protein ANN_23488 [Periplaneta americana]|uniref:Uncharacterized protein n=1 Tax=Periplaneta americana TaxID=6978 RepID=A0ABQ8SMP1_PERAM|nr:hypothetical protein ANN_23488 [Periplaneta americana]